MKNRYTQIGDCALVWLSNGFAMLIDADDLSIVASVPGTWRATRLSSKSTFYAATHVRKPEGGHATLLAHRLILRLNQGDKWVVDHINHQGLDNRRHNLRVASKSENALNRRGANRNSKTGILGVSFHRGSGRWQAYVQVDGKPRHLGRFSTKEAAAAKAKAYRTQIIPHGAVVSAPSTLT